MNSMQPLERPRTQQELRGEWAVLLPQRHASPAQSTSAFAPILRADPGRPFVVAQLGQSLDGRIATTTGESRYISGSGALDHLHALRAHVDAVVVGIGTVLADDPLLTVRRVPGRSPARVILDPNGKLPDQARCFRESDTRCLVVRACDAPTPGGIEVVRLPADSGGRIDPCAIVDALFSRGLRRLLIEGGADTISRFIDAGCLDRLHVLVAPVIIGSGKSSLELAPVGALEKALRPVADVYALADGDVLFDCDLRPLPK
jgi:diaminohydroxyphosphoribosylaminopyrimidine deaminase / 5-amino-6-(5-phosphoribosylamino)uracil reductase